MATPNNTHPRRPKKKKGVIFVRPGVIQLNRTNLELELSTQLAPLHLNQNVCESFEEMGLHPQILKGIAASGLEKPAYIQQRAIVPCIKGRDAIIQAQSGMGKTAALVITVLQRLNRNDPSCQALVLAPTRELAEQIQKVFIELSKFMVAPTVTNLLCAGGRGDAKQFKAKCSKGQVIIGTLGRISFMLHGDGDGTYLPVDALKILVLDEADQMLGGNYGRDLTTVLQRIPPPSQTQVILMSATLPGNILKLAWRFMVNPATFLVQDFQLTLDGIKQYYLNVRDNTDKMLTLVNLFPALQKSRGMIFCNTKKTVEDVVKRMRDSGYDVAAITGNMFQSQRATIMRKFRRGKSGYRLIVTSDLLGRGIDIQQIDLVVNYDLPTTKEAYIHRIGRAGRYGRKGIALSFVGPSQEPVLEGLKEFYHTQIVPLPINHRYQTLLTKSQGRSKQ